MVPAPLQIRLKLKIKINSSFLAPMDKYDFQGGTHQTVAPLVLSQLIGLL